MLVFKNERVLKYRAGLLAPWFGRVLDTLQVNTDANGKARCLCQLDSETHMTKKIIGSREYKIMLKAEKFIGNEQTLLAVASNFWNGFQQAIHELVIDTDGSLDKITKRRMICFYDTDACRLRNNDYVLRERVDIESAKREVTLKFRHPDRYIAQDRDMDARDVKEGKTKFEEDIKPTFNYKPPFLTLYSFSTKQKISASKKLNKMKDAVKLFPGLQKKLANYDEDEAIKIVGPFTARELVITGADFQISNTPKLEAECALVVWYNNEGDHTLPKLVEFSYKYKDKDENYTGEMAQRALAVFERLQRLESANPNSMPKTAFVYNLAGY
jgi:hypothetical protein